LICEDYSYGKIRLIELSFLMAYREESNPFLTLFWKFKRNYEEVALSDLEYPKKLRPAKGRPKAHSKDVVKSLLDATEALLETQNYNQVTERKIGAAAGVTDTMIHYYYGGKDELLFAVADRTFSEVQVKFGMLYDSIDAQNNPTQHIVEALIDAYYAKPWIVKMVTSELMNDQSAMAELFLKKYGPRALVELERVFRKLVELGIYNGKINMEYAALNLFSIIIAPILMSPVVEATGTSLNALINDDWIDQITNMFDSQLRT
jgi:AcrR family transcriptional regulator